ncbi:MAG: MBL fold metallo-hydrolase [Gammaproteobacteria bacterium]
MGKDFHLFIIDKDNKALDAYKKLLEQSEYTVTATTSIAQIMPRIVENRPDCVICDADVPGIDIAKLFQEIRNLKNIKPPKFVVLSDKLSDFSHKQALKLGVDAHFYKPIDPATFADDLLEIIEKRMVIQFWGVRGTLPVSGKKTNLYGGNTNCVTVSYAKKQFLIFDAGTGIKELSNYLIKQDAFPMSANILITHPHYDHINGIPFFMPLYMKGNDFEIYGTTHSGIGIEKLLSGQMDNIYFPITMKEFSAKLAFHNITPGDDFNIDELQVKTIMLNHPGQCIGFRIQHENKSFCYITDNELYLDDSPNYKREVVEELIEFIKDADIVVMDSTYSDDEYLKKIGWGHSCISRVIDIADRANVRELCLFHHDPDQDDKDIDAKLKHARSLLKLRHSNTRCTAAHEGDKIYI